MEPPASPTAVHSALSGYSALLLDLNGTFMFGGDRFGPEHDYAATYASLGGHERGQVVRQRIQDCFDHLLALYRDPARHEAFPSVREALVETSGDGLSPGELDLLEGTFARHELGRVPERHAHAVAALARRHRLALVADVWSVKGPWVDELGRVGLLDRFEAAVFSSDHGCVKPSPRLFRIAMARLGAKPQEGVVIGDSARRDVGGARAAGVAAVWIGSGRRPAGARWAVADLLDLVPECSPSLSG